MFGKLVDKLADAVARRMEARLPPVARPDSLFSTGGRVLPALRRVALPALPVPKPIPGVGMDANDAENSVKQISALGYAGIPDLQASWYGSQGFIGYQMCALLMQHWLIDKAVTMPAKDAIRKGYSLSLNDGTKLDADVHDFIKECDDIMMINHHMVDFVRWGRGYGIRIAKFVVESPDPDYYKKPFNIDGVEPFAYKGIAQIDPIWIVPELTTEQTLRPGNLHFYEPTFWRVNGESIHRSHLVIFTTGQVADILKPAYFYGGVSIPQRIYERVYAAERSANEAPMLLMTKRLTTLNTDLTEAMADQQTFDERMLWWTQTRDNYGVKINATGDEIKQFDLSLNDLDNVIMTQYQLVASIAEVPGTKLLGTQPKGFNSTGEFEEASYHEFLESLQTNDIAPLLRRHHLLVQKSYVIPKFGGKMLNLIVSWAELDAMTAQEQAAVNLTRSQGDAVLMSIGAIQSEDARKRLVNDPDSGYSGLSETLPPMPDVAGDPNDASSVGSNTPNDPDNPKNGPIAPKPRAMGAPPMKGA